MKTTVLWALCFVCGSLIAQTNQPVIFPILLSNPNVPLMTNAVYRSTFGTKVMFVSGLNLQGFDIAILNSNVLARLNIDPVKARQAQDAHALSTAQFNAA